MTIKRFTVKTEDSPEYKTSLTPVTFTPFTASYFIQFHSEEEIINKALSILEERLSVKVGREGLHSPDDVKKYLNLRIADLEHEVFMCLFMDSQHRVIAFDEMFRGTINGASVHPREVVKQALKHNAAAVIFAHNHPSGKAEPSPADIHLTNRLQEALEVVEIRVLDHIVVGANETVAFAERGLV